MIKVNYQIRHDEKDQVIDVFEKSFADDDQRHAYEQAFEQARLSHPFLTLHAVKVKAE